MITERPRWVTAEPNRWPATDRIDETEVALCAIDFQHDFCSPGGLADRCGYDIAAVQAARVSAKTALLAARRAGWTIVHTRVGRPAAMIPDLADSSATPTVGARGPLGRHLIRGEVGHEIVDDLAPEPGEFVIDKIGKGAFHCTELDLILRQRGITHLVLVGITSDVCVHSTFREAHDRGYSCLVVSDATGSYSSEAHAAAITLVATQGGIMGCHAPLNALLACLPTAAEISPSGGFDHRTAPANEENTP